MKDYSYVLFLYGFVEIQKLYVGRIGCFLVWFMLIEVVVGEEGCIYKYCFDNWRKVICGFSFRLY